MGDSLDLKYQPRTFEQLPADLLDVYTSTLPGELLTAEEERMLALEMREGQYTRTAKIAVSGLRTMLGYAPEEIPEIEQKISAGERARSTLIAYNTPLVIWRAKKFRGRGLEFSDLIQEGNIGLILAVDEFDPDRGARFSTFAIPRIDWVISRAITDIGHPIRIPVRVMEDVKRVHAASIYLGSLTDRPPTPNQIAVETGFAPGRVRELLEADKALASIDAPIGEESDYSLKERLANTPREDTADGSKYCLQDVEDALAALDERERSVVALRWGLNGFLVHSHRSVGKILGMSEGGIRRIEWKAIAKLKNASVQSVEDKREEARV